MRDTPYDVLEAALGTTDRGDDRVAALRGMVRRAAHVRHGEQRWLDRIETVRCALAASSYRIPVDGRTLSVGDFTTRASKNAMWGLWLMRLVRALRPLQCIELGTGVGISGAYIAAGLELAGGGTLTTIDGNYYCTEIAARVFAHLGLSSRVRVVRGKFSRVLEPTVRRSRHVDLAFIDGHHVEQATVRYATRLSRGGGVIVLDDIHWSPEMRRAWSSVARTPGSRLAADLGGVGLFIPPSSA